MAREEAALVGERALYGQIDFLLDPGGLPGYGHHDQRSPGVGSVSPSRLIAVALFRIERLPGQWQTKRRGFDQLRAFVHQRLEILRTPKVLLERWVDQKLRPETVVGRVANRLEEAAEDGSGDGSPRGLARIYGNRGASRYWLHDCDLRAAGERHERSSGDA